MLMWTNAIYMQAVNYYFTRVGDLEKHIMKKHCCINGFTGMGGEKIPQRLLY